MFKVLGSDQKEYGPISGDQLRQWIAQGRVNGQTRVQAEGGAEWKSLAEFPEFGAALNSAPRPAAMTGAGGVGPQKSGLAVTSLVLGILGVIGCTILTGIPAIITGHIAHSRAKREPGLFGGAGMALGGLIMGYLSFAMIPVVAIMAGLLLPALAAAKGKAQSINCVNNLKQVGLAARIYANDNNEVFPKDFLSMTNELGTPKILVCISDRGKTAAMDWSSFSSANVTYEMVSPGMTNDASASGTIFARCPIHGHVCLGDGSVQQGSRLRRR
ncbi:MAG TPA: DUF4190 domain-containing protein [Verrucomicrobiae bacterium]|jgi:hypothetical protein